MCIVSMIMDRGQKDLEDLLNPPWNPKTYPYIPIGEAIGEDDEIRKKHIKDILIKQMDIDPDEMDGFNPDIDVKDEMTLSEWVVYFENLLKLAKEFDTETGQPDCEDSIKKMAIKKIADELGVTINFPD